MSTHIHIEMNDTHTHICIYNTCRGEMSMEWCVKQQNVFFFFLYINLHLFCLYITPCNTSVSSTLLLLNVSRAMNMLILQWCVLFFEETQNNYDYYGNQNVWLFPLRVVFYLTQWFIIKFTSNKYIQQTQNKYITETPT